MNVLFLCTGNSARSILAETVLNARSEGRFHAFSAGSQPKNAPHPMALRVLEEAGYSTVNARSKSWDEFAAQDGPELQLVITLCDSAAAETCPVWPGAPVQTHWGLPDPAAVDGDDASLAAFRDTLAKIDLLITALLELPVDKLVPPALKKAMDKIGRQIRR